MAGYYGGYAGAGGGYGKPNGMVTPPPKSVNPYQYVGATHARSNSSIADIDQIPNVFNKEYNISSRSSKANKQHRGHSRGNIVTPPPSSRGGRRGVTPPPLVHATSACERRREVAPPPSHSRSRVPSACGGRRGVTPPPSRCRVPSVCGRSAATGVCARNIGTHATVAVGAPQEPCWDNHEHCCQCFFEWLKHFNHDFCSRANTPLKSFNNPCWNCGAAPMVPESSGIPFGLNGINDPAANGCYGNRSRNRTPGAHLHCSPSQSTTADINQLPNVFNKNCSKIAPAFTQVGPSSSNGTPNKSCNPYRHIGAGYAPSKSFIADVQKLPDVFCNDSNYRSPNPYCRSVRHCPSESSLADIRCLPDVFSRDYGTSIYSVHTCRSGANSPTSGVDTAKSFGDLTAREARSPMNVYIPPGAYPHHHHIAGYGKPSASSSSGYSNASSINPYQNAGVGRYIPSQASMADIHQLPNVFCGNYSNVAPAFTQVNTPSNPSPYTSASEFSTETSINPYHDSGFGRYLPSQTSLADIHQLPDVFNANYCNAAPAQARTPPNHSPFKNGNDCSVKTCRSP